MAILGVKIRYHNEACFLLLVFMSSSCFASACRMQWWLFWRQLYSRVPLQWRRYLCQGERWLSLTVCGWLERHQLSGWYVVFRLYFYSHTRNMLTTSFASTEWWQRLFLGQFVCPLDYWKRYESIFGDILLRGWVWTKAKVIKFWL